MPKRAFLGLPLNALPPACECNSCDSLPASVQLSDQVPDGSRLARSAPSSSYPQMGLAAESSKTISIVGVTTFEHNSLGLLIDQASEHDALAEATLTSDAALPSWVVSVQSKKRTSAIAKTLYWFQSSSAAGEKLNVAFAQATLEIYGGADGGCGRDG